MFAAEGNWSPPRLDSLPDWSLAKRIAIDTETCDPRLKDLGPGVRRGGRMVGVSFCIEDDRPYYLPFGHLGGDNLPEAAVLAYLRDNARRFQGVLVGANLNYDLDYLAQQGVTFPNIEWQRDIQIADPLIDELQLSYSLQAISERRGIPGKDETLLRQAARDFRVDPKGELWKLPARYVGPYAEQDAALPLQILRRQEREIEEQDLWQVYNLESRLQPVLLKMRRRGVRVSLDRLAQIEAWTRQEELEQLEQVRLRTGIRISADDLNKPEALAPALRHEGVVITNTATGKLNIDQELLSHAGEVGAWLMRARKVNKLRTTFAEGVREHLIGDRIHCTFNQLRRQKEDGDEGGARYGRLSCSDPNLQQQPARDDFSGRWRGIYIPDDGALWACMDYSQQEPRWLTHYAELYRGRGGRRLDGAYEAAERYRRDPSTDNHTMMTQMVHGEAVTTVANFKQLRDYCKQIYLGLCYGMGGPKMARKLGMSTKWIQLRSGKSIEVAGDEAQELLDKFDRGAPFIKQLASVCEDRAKERGVIVTALGRRCRFPKLESGAYDWCHKALNRLIQGSSADQTKKAVIDVDAAGFDLQLQVHDELDTSVGHPDDARKIAEIMRTCVPCNIPPKIDIEVGPSWGEIEKLK